MNIPKDNEEAKQKYNNMCCGQSVVAVIENISVEEAMQNWINILGEWKGYSPVREIIKYLESRGYGVKRLKIDNLGTFVFDKFYICRVQWIGDKENKDKPYYGWGHWSVATKNTHYILIHKGEIFCNSSGVFDYHKIVDYLGDIRRGERGKITSALEITKSMEVLQ